MVCRSKQAQRETGGGSSSTDFLDALHHDVAAAMPLRIGEARREALAASFIAYAQKKTVANNGRSAVDDLLFHVRAARAVPPFLGARALVHVA